MPVVPGGLTRSQKIRVQRLRNKELEPQKSIRPRTWHVKQIADKGKPSTDISTVFILPIEFKAPSRFVEESDEEDLEQAVAQLYL